MKNSEPLKKTYRRDIDIIKALSIVAVALYHALGDRCATGYLGVDVFFVVNGFLVLPGVYKSIVGGEFSLLRFLKKRISRMLPLLLIVCAVVLAISAVGMVPDDFLTVAESVVASSFFSNNLLSLFLCADYWDWTNEFKPLMHTWYLGILMELYVIIPLFMCVTNYICGILKKNKNKAQIFILSLMALASFAFFIMCTRNEWNFYLVPGRIYEFALGGLAGIYFEYKGEKTVDRADMKLKKIFHIAGVIGLIALLFCGMVSISVNNKLLLCLTVVCSVVCILSGDTWDYRGAIFDVFGCLGKASYSIFLWHQVVLALYRYFVSCEVNTTFWIVYIGAVTVLTIGSYLLIEKRVKIKTVRESLEWIIALGILCGLCLAVWNKGGVIRDIPELDVSKEKIEKRKNPQYVDRIYELDRPFSEKDDMKILVIGNSFARDFANVLLESDYSERMDITYSFSEPSDVLRIAQSDYIFVFGHPDSLTDDFWANVKAKENVFGIGTKNFGECIGQYYKNRNSADYFAQTGVISGQTIEEENKLIEEWGEQYIDILKVLTTEDGRVRIFSDDNRYISYDMHHLARAGAQYLSRELELDKYLQFE